MEPRRAISLDSALPHSVSRKVKIQAHVQQRLPWILTGLRDVGCRASHPAKLKFRHMQQNSLMNLHSTLVQLLLVQGMLHIYNYAAADHCHLWFLHNYAILYSSFGCGLTLWEAWFTNNGRGTSGKNFKSSHVIVNVYQLFYWGFYTNCIGVKYSL